LIVKAVLHLDRDCAAQGVKPVGRVAWHYIQTGDGILRDEVPIHGVADHFIDAHAVLIDRKALRRADRGRGHKAAKLHIRLERVAGGVVVENAWYALKQAVGHAVRPGVIKVLRRQRLGVGGNLVAIDTRNIDRPARAGGCRQGRGADDIDWWQLYGSLRRSTTRRERRYRNSRDDDHRKRISDVYHPEPRSDVLY